MLWGLWLNNGSQGRHQIARGLGEHLLAIAEREQDTSLLLQAHHALWTTLVNTGDLASAKVHLEQGWSEPHWLDSHWAEIRMPSGVVELIMLFPSCLQESTL